MLESEYVATGELMKSQCSFRSNILSVETVHTQTKFRFFELFECLQV